jgi:hypothetical protein
MKKKASRGAYAKGCRTYCLRPCFPNCWLAKICGRRTAEEKMVATKVALIEFIHQKTMDRSGQRADVI